MVLGSSTPRSYPMTLLSSRWSAMQYRYAMNSTVRIGCFACSEYRTTNRRSERVWSGPEDETRRMASVDTLRECPCYCGCSVDTRSRSAVRARFLRAQIRICVPNEAEMSRIDAKPTRSFVVQRIWGYRRGRTILCVRFGTRQASCRPEVQRVAGRREQVIPSRNDAEDEGRGVGGGIAHERRALQTKQGDDWSRASELVR